MSPSPHDVATAVLFLSLCGAAVTALVIVGKWLMRRSDAEAVAGQTFVSAEDAARAEVEADTLVMLAQAKASVDEALALLRGAS